MTIGGRGSSSSGGSGSIKNGFNGREYALDVNMGGGVKQRYYIVENSRGTLVARGINDAPETFSLTGAEMKARFEGKGATVKVLPPDEVAKIREANNNRPDYELGVGMADNRGHRKTARLNRLSTRMQRRKR